jgi:hypothetical protein
MITQSKADRQTSGCCSTVCEIEPDERAGGVDLSDPLLDENAFMGAGGTTQSCSTWLHLSAHGASVRLNGVRLGSTRVTGEVQAPCLSTASPTNFPALQVVIR